MLKIRLMRIGAKKIPFYRVVVVDERAKRTGAYIEEVGTYNPLTEPKDIKLKQDRIDHWIKQGAQRSVGFLRIIGKALQRPPRKPKKAASAESSGEPKEKKEEQPAAVQPTEAKAEEKPPEAPAETPAPEAAAEAKSDLAEAPAAETPAEEPAKEETPAESAKAEETPAEKAEEKKQ